MKIKEVFKALMTDTILFDWGVGKCRSDHL